MPTRTAAAPAVLATVVARVQDPSPRGIASAVSRLVHEGTLAAGTRLPTVRQLAEALGVSPATVSTAWRALAEHGILASRGRAGSHVLGPGAWLPPRYRGMARRPDHSAMDLSSGTPDPTLLPALGPAVGRLADRARTASYLEVPVLPALEEELRRSWPYPAPAITVVDGALDALSRSLELLVRFGDRVVVEDPGFPPVLDLIDQLGAEAVPVPLDTQGIVPAALARALDRSPVAVVLQPRAQNPTGISMTPSRASTLAEVIRTHPTGGRVTVIEDDHSGQIATAPDVSLGTDLAQVLHIRSFSKSHGPDLRIAALAGPDALVERIVARRMLGPGWTSRMLQAVLLDLLTRAEGRDAVAAARHAYHARQHALREALGREGIDLPAPDGVNLWVPVADEAGAVLRLEAAGIRVAPGAPFRVTTATGSAGHLRVTVGHLASGAEAVAAVLARAAR